MRLLVVEDEIAISTSIYTDLTVAGFAVQTCDNGDEAWFLGSTEVYSAIVLDLSLPGIDGLTVLARWREEKIATPVIILACGDWTERVTGINTGADDCLPKPFQMEELVARLRGLLRRANGQLNPQIKAGQIELDTNKMRVTLDGQIVQLTPLEFRLINYLAINQRRVVSCEELRDHIYCRDGGRNDNAIEATITRLRRKLGFGHIETRRGHGYCLKV